MITLCACACSSAIADDIEETYTLPDDEIIYLYNMGVEGIVQYIRGEVFQMGSDIVAADIGNVICFTPQGNEYYWFCTSMDQESRIRAEYGTWELKDGFMATTTLKFIEWIDGHFTSAEGSTGSRFELEDYHEVLTEADIKSEFNFRMFKFLQDDSEEEALGFYYGGAHYYYYSSFTSFDEIEEYFAYYISLLTK